MVRLKLGLPDVRFVCIRKFSVYSKLKSKMFSYIIERERRKVNNLFKQLFQKKIDMFKQV